MKSKPNGPWNVVDWNIIDTLLELLFSLSLSLKILSNKKSCNVTEALKVFVNSWVYCFYSSAKSIYIVNIKVCWWLQKKSL